MKFNLLLLLFFFPFLVLSQEAFEETKILLQNEEFLQREDLQELMEIYVEKTNFNLEEKGQVDLMALFVENPFREDFDYYEFSTFGISELRRYIQQNYEKKYEIDEEDYHLLLECDPSFPESYQAYLNDEKVVLSSSDMSCFRSKYNLKHMIEEVAEEEGYPNGIVEAGAGISLDSDWDASGSQPSINNPTTQIIDATAQFLVDRVKEELLLAFFDRFLAQVDNSTELTALMPNTYFLLKNNDVFKVPSMGEVWMTAFEEDLNSIPSNFSLMVKTHPDYIELKNKPEIELFRMAGFIYQQIKEESSLEEMFDLIVEEFDGSNSQLILMIDVVDLLLQNLESENDFNIEFNLISKVDFQNLLFNYENASLYFSGLVYQQERELFNKIKIPFAGVQMVLGDLIKVNYKDFALMTGKVLTKVNQLKKSKYEFDDKKYLKDTEVEKYQEAVVGFANSIFEFIDYSIELAYFAKPDLFYTSPYYSTYRPVAQKTILTLDAGLRKDYGQLMIYSMQMMEPLVQVRIDNLEDELSSTGSNFLSRSDEKKIEQEIKILGGVVKNFMYYGGFMVDVLSSNSTGEIKGIIHKYAAPVGSYRVKRQSSFSVSLSSYPGLYGGWETTHSGSESASLVTGVTAPIGLSLNWGDNFYGMRVKGHSFSFYVPIVDIGAAFSYRWNNSEGGGFPEEIKWEQIISPGVHVVWGIGNTPMAFMLGAQYTPLLRKITDQNNELQPNAWRVGASISVDIPIFHFFRSNK